MNVGGNLMLFHDHFIRIQEDYLHVNVISTAVSHTTIHHDPAMAKLDC
jgi:hypothetical protein